ncbi:PLD nuclease N-terminal domain-containing protein [Demequina sp. NBRC 110056]|uniref:PLD nuclease N-terminal domain-containing protein n=1 Tax=Demequina sp. NBRC 110056 TaxID=1570345 RepID=UPI0009FBBD2A|nr:PLD nuclease N-terminal domain-containing protein [Demequina sp. NBRC 110056]
MRIDPMTVVPASYDAVWGFVALALVAITVAAVVSELRHSSVLSGRVLAVWLVITIVFPPLGAIVWFLAGRPTARRDLAASAAQTDPPQLDR